MPAWNPHPYVLVGVRRYFAGYGKRNLVINPATKPLTYNMSCLEDVLGSMVAQAVAASCPKTVKCLSLPDAPVVTGTSQEVFDHYGLNAEGIIKTVKGLL